MIRMTLWSYTTLTDVADRGAAGRNLRLSRRGAGDRGVISSVSDPFCDACDWLRLTADGRLLTCLFVLRDTDLRGPLRDGASDEELARIGG